jgi:hypothetical protein
LRWGAEAETKAKRGPPPKLYITILLLGVQGQHADYCKATETIALTEVDVGFQEKRDLFTEHLCLVSGAGQCGARKFRWLKAATDCRPGFV